MEHKLKLVFCLSATLLAATASWAQTASTSDAASTAPVAYVYVTSLPANASATEIEGYSVAANGTLTALTDSPFQENEADITVARGHLFGINRANTNIDSYAIESDGVLRYVTSTDFAQYNPNDCGYANWVFPDRTGANLYNMEFDGDCANNGFQSYKVRPASGELKYLGYANGGAGSFGGANLPLTFTGNNLFGYEATNDSCMYYSVLGYQRGAKGNLDSLSFTWTPPAPPDGYRGYITAFLAADPTNHLAVVLQPANPPGCSAINPQIGSVTVNGKGDLSTTNTSANMPTTLVSTVYDMKVSPSGTLVAVGGQGGLQLFHFNAANPPTTYTPLLTTDTISEMFWDNSHHLYAISQATSTLHVYTVTATGYSEAPGSPYTVSQPVAVAVQPK